MAKLRHQNAATIFDAGNLPDGRYFIIMEFVEGELFRRRSSVRVVSAQRVGPNRNRFATFLKKPTGLGIIHRDLKPSNIMLSERGVCVLDFGVAKVLALPLTHCHSRKHRLRSDCRNTALYVARTVPGPTCWCAQRSL